jgi:hypothetical protein
MKLRRTVSPAEDSDGAEKTAALPLLTNTQLTDRGRTVTPILFAIFLTNSKLA